MKNNTIASNSSLKKLINKKITIGQTDKGKMLVGKIINVIKKADINISKNKTSDINAVKKNQNIRKNSLMPSEKLKEISKAPANQIINEASNASRKTSLRTSDWNLNRSACTSVSYPPPRTGVISSKKKNNDQETSTNAKQILPQKSLTTESKILKRGMSAVQNEPTTQENPKIIKAEKSPEHSKIIIQKKVVTKDCFDVITRTLTGLMNMDTIVRKLKNRTIIIKIIEKTYNQDRKDYSRTISYCSGYMVRECKLNDEESSFSEAWKFIPDTNAKDTILGQDNLEALMQNGVPTQQGLKKFANLTIQITINSEGNRSTKVIINPPVLFQCKACFKNFRSNALLKVHSMDCHTPTGLKCSDCSLKFATIAETKEHSLSCHSNEKNKGMYECMECNQCFQTPFQIRKHMDIHYTPNGCPICKVSCSCVKELNKHMSTHSDLSLPQLDPIVSMEQVCANNKGFERKMFSCHICSRQFSRHSNLQRHIEIHQGAGAMYQCAVCSCSYHYISSLTRHVVSCHVDKSKKLPPNVVNNQSNSQDAGNLNQDQSVRFMQDDQIVQMIPLEQMSEESLQRYASENMEIVAKDFQGTGDGIQVFEIPEYCYKELTQQ